MDVRFVLLGLASLAALNPTEAGDMDCINLEKWEFQPNKEGNPLYKFQGITWQNTGKSNHAKFTAYIIDRNGKNVLCNKFKKNEKSPKVFVQDGWTYARCAKNIIGKGARLQTSGGFLKVCGSKGEEKKIWVEAVAWCDGKLGLVLNQQRSKCVPKPKPKPPKPATKPKPKPKPKPGPAGIGYTAPAGACVWVEGDVQHKDDHKSYATCPYDRVIHLCECAIGKGGKYCDGVTVTADGKTCRAHGAHGGGSFKARGCCRGRQGRIIVESKPATLIDGHGFAKGPTVDCPAGTRIISCTLHTFWRHYGHLRNMKPVRRGQRCSAPTACDKCGIQAICEAKSAKSDCLYNVRGSEKKGDDQISEATCPDDTVVTKCVCQKNSASGHCDGWMMSGDGTKCYAHGGNGATVFQANACCGRRKGSVLVVSEPFFITDMALGVGWKSNRYVDSPTAKCPKGWKPSFCNIHTYWSSYWSKLKAKISGQECHADIRCDKCAVQAVCTKNKAAGNCAYEIQGSWVHKDDQFSEVVCPKDHIVSSCSCVKKNAKSFCDGVTISPDVRLCRAHGAGHGGHIKPKACCKRHTGVVSVVSKPSNMIDGRKYYGHAKGPTVDCPKGTKIVSCTLHTYWRHEGGLRNQRPSKSGRRCSAAGNCSKCGVQAICESHKKADNKCQSQVLGREENGDDRISHAVCPLGTEVTSCEGVKHGNGLIDGVMLSGDGRVCRAHGAQPRLGFQAKACCGNFKGSVLVSSKPFFITDMTRSVGDKSGKYLDSPIASCPKGSKPVYCLVHSYWTTYAKVRKAAISGNGCNADIKCDKCAVQAVCLKKWCTGNKCPGAPGSGDVSGGGGQGGQNGCFVAEGDVQNKDDSKSYATCPYDQIVHKCKCIMVDGQYCDGVTITTDGKTCRAHGAYKGGSFKVHACCKRRRGMVIVESKPANLIDGSGYARGPTVDCPSGSRIVSCTLHTFWRHEGRLRNQKPKKTGRRCSADSSCHKCGIQAICEYKQNPPKSYYVVRGTEKKGDDHISEATCPDDTAVTKCECQKNSAGGHCDGWMMSGDGTKCYAHGGNHHTVFQARASCGRRTGSVLVVSNPFFVTDMALSVGWKSNRYVDSPTAECPKGWKPSFCNIHTYWSKWWGKLKAKIHGRSCHADRKCDKCSVQAVCTRAKVGGNCAYEIQGSWVHKDDQFSEVVCPNDHIVSSCTCVKENAKSFCDGVTISSDARLCRAHGAGHGGHIKPRACCKKLNGKVEVVSKPSSMIDGRKYYGHAKGPTVDCPKGTKIVSCTLHTYWRHERGLRAQKPSVSGRRCSASGSCHKCGVQAICESTKKAKSSCRYEVMGREENGDDRVSYATCPQGTTWVTSCFVYIRGVNKVEHAMKKIDGVMLSGDARTCRAHGARANVKFQARACCGHSAKGIVVASNPYYITDMSRGGKDRHYVDSPMVSCPKGFKPWYCLVHSYWTNYEKFRKAKIAGRGCNADIKCDKCAVQAVCKASP